MSVAIPLDILKSCISALKSLEWVDDFPHASTNNLKKNIATKTGIGQTTIASMLTCFLNSDGVKMYQAFNKELHVPLCFGLFVKKNLGLAFNISKKSRIQEFGEFNATLRTNQVDIIEKAEEYLKKGSVLLNCDTGTGKTMMSIYLACSLKLKTLIIVPIRNVAEQWINSFNSNTCDVSIEFLDNKFKDASVLVSTPQTINSLLKSEEHKQQTQTILNSIGTLIIDEAHMFCTEKYFNTLMHVSPIRVIACTATIERADNQHLMLYFLVNKNHTLILKNEKDMTVVPISVYSGCIPMKRLQKNMLSECSDCFIDSSLIKICDNHIKSSQKIDKLLANEWSNIKCPKHKKYFNELKNNMFECKECKAHLYEFCNEHNEKYENILQYCFSCSECSNFRKHKQDLPNDLRIDYSFCQTQIGQCEFRIDLIVAIADYEINIKNEKVIIPVSRTDYATKILLKLTEKGIRTARFMGNDKSYSNCSCVVGTSSKMGTGTDEATLCVNFDGKPSRVIIFATSIKDKSKFRQMLGRVRDREVKVYDLIDSEKSGIFRSHYYSRKKIYEDIGATIQETIKVKSDKDIENVIDSLNE